MRSETPEMLGLRDRLPLHPAAGAGLRDRARAGASAERGYEELARYLGDLSIHDEAAAKTGRVIARCYLTYDASLSRPNQFIWLPEIESIRARIQIASAAEVAPVDIHLRFRGRAKAPGLVFCRPLNEEMFSLEDALVHPDLPRMQIVLVSVPERIAQQIRAL